MFSLGNLSEFFIENIRLHRRFSLKLLFNTLIICGNDFIVNNIVFIVLMQLGHDSC